MFLEKLQKLVSRQYYPLNRLEISRSKLINNYKRLCLINKKIKVAPVLKSNAYGHGLVTVGKILDSLNPPFFCVDSLYEAYKLYKAKIKSKILIMGTVNPENLSVKKLPFSYAVCDLDKLKQILKYQPSAGIHIFVDTGMHREGIRVDRLENFAKSIPQDAHKNIEGIMSHFGASEFPKQKETKEQFDNFQKAVLILKNYKINPSWKHIGNSCGLLNHKILNLEEVSNLVRTGLILYQGVLRFITHIGQVKELKKGESVGYNFTYKAKKNITMAVLPVGYNDGVDRVLSNRGKVLIKGRSCPIIGRVSMNITTIDISKVKDVKVGDEAEIIFNPKTKERIPYEFLIHLNPQIKRVVVD